VIKRTGVATILLGCLFWLQGSSAQATPYQRYQNGACVGLTCAIDFPKAPAGKRLVIQNASCYLRVSNSADIYALQLLILNNADTLISAQTFTPQFVDSITTPSERVYSGTHSIFAFANAGQRFQVYAELKAGSFSQLACHISGDMQNAP
jgi:hypothetical protein